MPGEYETYLKEKPFIYIAEVKVLIFILYRKLMLVQQMSLYGKISGIMKCGFPMEIIGQQGSPY